MTHVSERADAERQPWSASNGKTTRKRTVTYADAGVSIHAGEQAVEMLKTKVHRTWRPEVVGDLGGFAGLFRLDIDEVQEPDPGLVRRRRRHQAGHRPADGHPRHGRRRPGRDGRRRSGRVRCRAAVPARLHRLRRGRPGEGRRDRRRHRRRLPDGRLRAARRRDRRAPGHDGAARVRHLRHRRRRGRGGRDARPGPGRGRRRGDRDGLVRHALQRLLAGAPRAARRRPDAAGQHRRGAGPARRRSARSCSRRPGSTRATASI